MAYLKVLKKVVFLLLIFKTVESTHSNEIYSDNDDVDPDPEMEQYLREALENFRQQMKEGIPAISMPVLDPLQLQNLDIIVQENLAVMNLKIKEISVRRLSLFNVTSLKPNLQQLYLAINLTLPSLTIDGLYSVNGKFVKIVPIYGAGNFEINATNVCIAGQGQLQYENGTLKMSLLKLDLLWQHIVVYLENFLGGGDFSEVLQRVVPDVGRDVFIAYKPLILGKLECALTSKINEKLNDPVIKDIISSIFPEK